MTLAERKDPSSPHRKSWMQRLRSASDLGLPQRIPLGVNPASDRHKPHGDIADLLVMSTVDTKAPPAPPRAPGADLLDVLVEEHLQRDTAPPKASEPPKVDGGAAREEEPAEAAVESAEASVSMLQREIEMLLSGTPTGADEAPAAAAGEESPASAAALPAAVAAPVAEVAVEEATASPAVTELSREELDVLLAKEAGTLAEEVGVPTPQAADEAPAVAVETVEEKLSEAEGVLADELSQLLADNAGGEGAAEAPGLKESAAVPASVKVPANLPAEAVQAAETTVPAADAPPVTPAATEQTTASTSPPAAPAVAASSSASPPVAAANAPTPEAAPAPAENPASEITPAEPAAADLVSGEGTPDAVTPALAGGNSFLDKVQHLVGNLLLMIAQLLDIPFNWLDDLSKNIIGVAAFLLLLGGAVLWAMANFTPIGGR